MGARATPKEENPFELRQLFKQDFPRRADKEWFLHKRKGAPPGYRMYNSGALWCAGDYGYSWASSIHSGSGHAHSLHFNNGGIAPNNSNYRTYGRQLRCLQE